MARLPSLNWLRVFEAAARCESFARAAVELNMSAAAVSQQIKALEAQLGTDLFRRRAQAVELTEAGRAYVPVVAQSLGLLEGATEGLFGQRRQDRLFVQASLLFAHGILAPHLGRFAAAHPEIALHLTTPNAAQDFGRAFSDLSIVFGTPEVLGRQSEALLGEVLSPVAIPALSAQIGAPGDLLQVPLIEVAPHRAGWPYVLERLGLRDRVARWVYADSTVMAAALAASGAGVALARAPASDAIMAAHGLTRCLPDLEVAGTEQYHLVYDDLRKLHPAARRFRDWLRGGDGPLPPGLRHSVAGFA